MSGKDMGILYVYPRPADARDPGAGGAENRTSHLLAETGKEYDVALLQAEPDAPSAVASTCECHFFPALTPMFLTDFNPVYVLRLLRLLRRTEYDVIQIESLGGILAAILLTTLLDQQTSVVYGSHNVEAERVEEMTNPAIPVYKRLAGPAVIPVLERLAVRYADYVIAVSERDRDTFCARYAIAPASVFVVPSGTELQSVGTLADRQAVRSQYGIADDDLCLVFHGTYGNYANREALSHIRSELLPAFRDADHSIRVVVAGNGMPEFDGEDILSVGFVPDLYAFLSAMDIAIVPLTSGSGTKLKVFDYMTLGLPIVATETAMEGIDVEPGTHALVADGVDARFEEHVLALAADPGARTTVGTNARTLIEHRYNWTEIGERLRETYRQIAPRPTASEA